MDREMSALPDPVEDISAWLNAILDEARVDESLLSTAQLARRQLLRHEVTPLALQLAPDSEVEEARQLARDSRRWTRASLAKYRADVDDFAPHDKLELHAATAVAVKGKLAFAIELVWQDGRWKYHDLRLPQLNKEQWVETAADAMRRGQDRLRAAHEREAEEGYWSGYSDEDESLAKTEEAECASGTEATDMVPSQSTSVAETGWIELSALEPVHNRDPHDGEEALKQTLRGIYELWMRGRPASDNAAETFVRVATEIAMSA